MVSKQPEPVPTYTWTLLTNGRFVGVVAHIKHRITPNKQTNDNTQTTTTTTSQLRRSWFTYVLHTQFDPCILVSRHDADRVPIRESVPRVMCGEHVSALIRCGEASLLAPPHRSLLLPSLRRHSRSQYSQLFWVCYSTTRIVLSGDAVQMTVNKSTAHQAFLDTFLNIPPFVSVVLSLPLWCIKVVAGTPAPPHLHLENAPPSPLCPSFVLFHSGRGKSIGNTPPYSRCPSFLCAAEVANSSKHASLLSPYSFDVYRIVR